MGGTPAGAPRTGLRAPFGLYVHVPFCTVKCGYCAFYSRAGHDPGEHGVFLEGLAREAARDAVSGISGGRAAETLFLGGGTPSFLSAPELSRLFESLRAAFPLREGAEITSEANPESLTPEKAAHLAWLGVNRVSLGAQSFDAELLRALDRAHGPAEIGAAVRSARGAGIENLNLDLMFGLPGQSLETFRITLERAIDLGPDHVSAYCLSFEAGTPFGERAREGELHHDEELEREQYDLAVERLEGAGYDHYEISNFARPGHSSRHNSLYWQGGDWLGLGPSAHSRIGPWKAANPGSLTSWAGRPEPAPGAGDGRFWRRSAREEDLVERFFLALRTSEGVQRAGCEAAWGSPLEEVFPGVLERYRGAGLLREKGGRLSIDRGAWFVSDEILSDLLASRPDPEPAGENSSGFGLDSSSSGLIGWIRSPD